MGDTQGKPTTYIGNLANPPRALAPLVERRQWAVFRWMRQRDRWQKPPFMAAQPDRHASTKDPATWSDHASALAAVQAGKADGLTYILTEDDPFGAVDIDYCRDLVTCSIDIWAQNFLDVGRHTYSEVTPSGTGCRIWGLADGEPLHKRYSLVIDGKPVGVELFRRTRKALTITGYRLDSIQQLTSIDRLFDWAIVWAERRQAAAAVSAAPTLNGYNGNGSTYTVEQIDEIVREGAPAGTNRSDVFHTVVGHYLGCGWSVEQIQQYLQQFPDGIGSRYLAEERLHKEIARSAGKFSAGLLPQFDGNGGWVNGWEAKQPEPSQQSEIEKEEPAPELEEELDLSELEEEPDPPEPEKDFELDEDLQDEQAPARDPKLPDEQAPARDPKLPPLYAHGDPDPRPRKGWLVKHVVPVVGHGLLSGQWATGKTFVAFDLAAALGTGQPWLGHAVKRQCGVLLIVAEGADEFGCVSMPSSRRSAAACSERRYVGTRQRRCFYTREPSSC